MTAFNVVRFRALPGKEEALLEQYRAMKPDLAGMRRFSIIKTGERSFCLVGEWDDMASIVKARPVLIARLDSMRDKLEDLGGGLGVTDPVSGETVVEHLA